MERVYASRTSEYAMTEERVVPDRELWSTVWTQLHNGLVEPPRPTIDFETSSLVLIAVGQRNTAGTSVQVDSVTQLATGAVIAYTVSEPGAGCLTAQVITSPVVVVRVPRIALPVRFVRRTVQQPC